ncbi:hypothetical protein F5878DRAFT_607716, partial [Lentinula raphanica]
MFSIQTSILLHVPVSLFHLLLQSCFRVARLTRRDTFVRASSNDRFPSFPSPSITHSYADSFAPVVGTRVAYAIAWTASHQSPIR